MLMYLTPLHVPHFPVSLWPVAKCLNRRQLPRNWLVLQNDVTPSHLLINRRPYVPSPYDYLGQSRRIHLLGQWWIALIILTGTPHIQWHCRWTGGRVSGHVPLFTYPSAALGYRTYVKVVQGTTGWVLASFDGVFATSIGGSCWSCRLHHCWGRWMTS